MGNCVITGATGGWVSTIRFRVLETVERFPLSIDFAVMAYVPSAKLVGKVNDQLPLLSAVAVPANTPPRYTFTVTPESADPLTVGWETPASAPLVTEGAAGVTKKLC